MTLAGGSTLLIRVFSGHNPVKLAITSLKKDKEPSRPWLTSSRWVPLILFWEV